ncbi:MAG: hypothetical protein LBK75_11040 [Oscillospiraceae bacterium]|jgi:hypothetical protein|nr:hypothetical protein [Oscillospiraceae bacterium]
MAFLVVGLLGGCLVAFVLVALYLRPILLDAIRRVPTQHAARSTQHCPKGPESEEERLVQERMARRVETLMGYTPPSGLRPNDVRNRMDN